MIPDDQHGRFVYAIAEARLQYKARLLLQNLPEAVFSSTDADLVCDSFEDSLIGELIEDGYVTSREVETCIWYTTTEAGRDWLLDYIKGERA